MLLRPSQRFACRDRMAMGRRFGEIRVGRARLIVLAALRTGRRSQATLLRRAPFASLVAPRRRR
jgi:hypothetical protein